MREGNGSPKSDHTFKFSDWIFLGMHGEPVRGNWVKLVIQNLMRCPEQRRRTYISSVTAPFFISRIQQFLLYGIAFYLIDSWWDVFVFVLFSLFLHCHLQNWIDYSWVMNKVDMQMHTDVVNILRKVGLASISSLTF